MPERLGYSPVSEPSVPPPILEPSFIAIEPAEFAFSKKTRGIIYQRDHGKSVISGSDVNIEAAHISHDKKLPNYDSPSNGRLLTAVEHLVDHKVRAGRNGLAENHNNWAIKMIQKKLFGKYHRNGDPQ